MDSEKNNKNLDKLRKLTSELNDKDKKLKEERDIYQFLAEESNDGYWDWEMDFSIPIEENNEYMSPRFWEIFGFLPEEKEHKAGAWMDMINEEDEKLAMDNVTKHIATKGKHPYKQYVRYTHKDGSTVWVLCKGKVISWNDDGSAARMIGTHTDVTLIKKSEMELDGSNESLHIVDGNASILWASKKEMEGLGYEPEDYIGKCIIDFHIDRVVIDDMLATLIGGGELNNYPARIRAKDGSEMHFLINSSGYFENGKFSHTRCFSRNMTYSMDLSEQIQNNILRINLKNNSDGK